MPFVLPACRRYRRSAARRWPDKHRNGRWEQAPALYQKYRYIARSSRKIRFCHPRCLDDLPTTRGGRCRELQKQDRLPRDSSALPRLVKGEDGSGTGISCVTERPRFRHRKDLRATRTSGIPLKADAPEICNPTHLTCPCPPCPLTHAIWPDHRNNCPQRFASPSIQSCDVLP